MQLLHIALGSPQPDQGALESREDQNMALLGALGIEGIDSPSMEVAIPATPHSNTSAMTMAATRTVFRTSPSAFTPVVRPTRWNFISKTSHPICLKGTGSTMRAVTVRYSSGRWPIRTNGEQTGLADALDRAVALLSRAA